VVPALTEFRDTRKTHIVGPDVCGTGHAALNFTGSAGAAGEAWIAVYDTTPADNSVENLYSSVNLSADLLFRSFNNKKGAGVMALFNEGAADKGLAVVAYDNGNTDTLVLGTVSKSSGQVTPLAPPVTVSLGNGVAECAWYRIVVSYSVTGGNVTVTARVFRHTVSNDPNSLLGPQVGTTLSFTGPLPAGVSAIGEVGVVAQAASAIVDTSIVNFTINP
jgi:hypothetical protein